MASTLGRGGISVSRSIDGDDDSPVCRVLSPNSLSLVPVKLEECFVVDTAFDPRGFDPRTEDSVPSVLPDDATATGADVAVEAAETRLTARAVRELLAALGGSIGDEDELVVLLQRASKSRTTPSTAPTASASPSILPGRPTPPFTPIRGPARRHRAIRRRRRTMSARGSNR